MDLSSIRPETQLNAHSSSSSKRLVPDHQTDSNPRSWGILLLFPWSSMALNRFKPTSVGDTIQPPYEYASDLRFKPTSVGDTRLGFRGHVSLPRFKPTSVGDT